MICSTFEKKAGDLSVPEMEVRLAGIDWSFLGKKLLSLGHDENVIRVMMADYQKFLILFGVVGREFRIIPWGALDKVWHEHILHTSKYERDCHRLFGCTLHHNPELEFGSEDHKRDLEATRRVYEKYFQGPMPDYVE